MAISTYSITGCDNYNGSPRSHFNQNSLSPESRESIKLDKDELREYVKELVKEEYDKLSDKDKKDLKLELRRDYDDLGRRVYKLEQDTNRIESKLNTRE